MAGPGRAGRGRQLSLAVSRPAFIELVEAAYLCIYWTTIVDDVCRHSHRLRRLTITAVRRAGGWEGGGCARCAVNVHACGAS